MIFDKTVSISLEKWVLEQTELVLLHSFFWISEISTKNTLFIDNTFTEKPKLKSYISSLWVPKPARFSKKQQQQKKVEILDSSYVFILHLWNMQFVYYHFYWYRWNYWPYEIVEPCRPVGLDCFCLVANVFWIKDMAASGRSAASLCSSLLSYVQRKGELI